MARKLVRCPECKALTYNREHCGRGRGVNRVRCRLYDTRRWRRFSAATIAANPTCGRCPQPATELHHVNGHDGTAATFFTGPFEPLCKSCHAMIED